MELRTPSDVGKALAAFTREPNGRVWLSDRFMDLSSALHMRSAKGEDVFQLAAAVTSLASEHGSLLTILERSEWQKRCAKNGQLDDTSWFFFAGLDVEHFYIVVRSLFDHLASVCDAVATKRGQCPQSFSSLLIWCASERARADALLGQDLVELVLGCDWFESVRDTRDGIIHFGALTLAFPSADSMSFKVYAGARSSIVPPSLMNSENIADFELFMAWVLGNLGLVLDRVGEILLARMGEGDRFDSRYHRPGFATLVFHLERLSDRLSQGYTSQIPTVNSREHR